MDWFTYNLVFKEYLHFLHGQEINFPVQSEVLPSLYHCKSLKHGWISFVFPFFTIKAYYFTNLSPTTALLFWGKCIRVSCRFSKGGKGNMGMGVFSSANSQQLPTVWDKCNYQLTPDNEITVFDHPLWLDQLAIELHFKIKHEHWSSNCT